MSLALTTLVNSNRPISTRQVAKFLDVSWKTARDNLEALFRLQMVERGKVGKNKRIYWKTDEKIIRTLSLKEIEKKEKMLNIKEDGHSELEGVVQGHIYKRKYSIKKSKY